METMRSESVDTGTSAVPDHTGIRVKRACGDLTGADRDSDADITLMDERWERA